MLAKYSHLGKIISEGFSPIFEHLCFKEKSRETAGAWKLFSENKNLPSKIISPNCAKVVAVTVFGTGSDLANAFLQKLYVPLDSWNIYVFMIENENFNQLF